MSDAEARRGHRCERGLPQWKIICKLHFNKNLNLK